MKWRSRTRNGRPRDERYEQLKLSSAPAIIVGDLVRFICLCPTREGPIGAPREAGLE